MLAAKPVSIQFNHLLAKLHSRQRLQFRFSLYSHPKRPSSGGIVIGGLARSQKMTKAKMRAVFFDLDDTLVETSACDKVAHAKCIERLQGKRPEVDAQKVLQAFLDGFRTVPWDPEGKVQVTEWRARFWLKGLQSQGLDEPALARELQDCFDTSRLAVLRWLPGVEEFLAELKARGIHVFIITNGHPEIQRAKIEACKAADIFGEKILIGGDHTFEKPHKVIFEKAAQICGCELSETVMVGDSLQADIQGGKNAGCLATVWVNYKKATSLPEGAPHPDYTIMDISELPRVLAEIEAK